MVFSIPSFLCVGDEYDKRHLQDERSKGKNFVSPGPKKGKLPDALFTKEYRSIHEGDPFVDTKKQEQRARMEREKKKICDKVWRPANPPKRPTGLGTYYGCCDETPIPHETDYIVPRKGDAPRKQPISKRNIYTSPPKRGTYGFPGTTLSAIGQDYIACTFDAARDAKRKEELKAKIQSKGQSFKAACRLGRTFDEGMGTGVSQCYVLTQPMPPKKPFVGFTGLKGPEAPWKPAGKVTQEVPLEYREDPYDGFDPRVPKAKKAKSDKERAAFRPSGATNSSWYTKSIAFARL